MTHSFKVSACLIWVIAALFSPAPDAAAQDGLTGQVYMTAAFCRAGSVEADGRTVGLGQNTALYSLLGRAYGSASEGVTVPDLRARAPMGIGAAPNGAAVMRGDRRGAEAAALTGLPSHDHAEGSHAHTAPEHSHAAELMVSVDLPTEAGPQGHAFATFASTLIYTDDGAPNIRLAGGTLITDDSGPVNPSEPAQVEFGETGETGQSAPIDIRDPFLGVKFCIYTDATYPSRP